LGGVEVKMGYSLAEKRMDEENRGLVSEHWMAQGNDTLYI